MMPLARPTPEIMQLEASRVRVRERLRWLAPNARRAKELAAEQRRLTIAALKAEVAGAYAESQKARNPDRADDERRPRFWWVEQDS
jgi:hypothetical protein